MKIIIFIFSLFLVAAVNAENYYTDNVVIVLDGSGSMSDLMSGTRTTKMDAAKKALHQVLKQVPATTHIGLLVFCETSGANGWLYPLGPKSAALDAAIDKPVSSGGTPLGSYIKAGADRLLEAKKKQHGYGSYRLLVVTDGEASDQKELERYVPDVMSRGILIDVIGVSMNSRHTLATKVSSYRNANNPESLKSAVNEVLAEVSPTSGNANDAEAFAIIAPLPDAMAKEMLTALANSGTEPIGTIRKKAVIATPPPVKTSPAVQPTAPSPAPTVQADNKMPTSKMIFIIFIAVVAIFIIKAAMKKKER